MSLPRITLGQHVAESGAVYDRIEMKDLIRLVAHAAGLDAEGIASIAVPKGASYALIFKPKMPKAHKPAVSQGPASPAVSVKPEAPAQDAMAAMQAQIAALLAGFQALQQGGQPAKEEAPQAKPLSLGQPVKGRGKRAA